MATTICRWLITATLMTCSGIALAQSNEHNWLNVDSTTWRTGDGTLCWRNSSWTPATGNADCEGSPCAAPSPTSPPAPPSLPLIITNDKISFAADTFFDFNKVTLKPAAKEVLDEMARRLEEIDLEVIVIVGHTDSIGPARYNQQLSQRRADAVKAYLVNQGVQAERIYVEGKGETQPVATNATRAGRAQNRRVEIEVVGTVTRP